MKEHELRLNLPALIENTNTPFSPALPQDRKSSYSTIDV